MSNTIDMAAIQSVTLGGGGLTTLAAAVAALPPTGGKITVAPNYTETLSADISIAMPDVNIEFMGPATITMGSHVIKTPAGLSYPSVSGFSITGPMRGSRDTPLPSFIYTGAGTAIQVGAADRAVFGVRLAGFAVDLQGAGDAAIGVGLKQVQYVTADRVAVRGHSGAGRTQKGFYLDGNGTDTNFSAYQVFKDCSVYGVQIGYDVDGPAFGNNANMWIGGDVSTNTTDGNAVYIRTGDTNNLIGTDLFANNIGVRFGGNAADNHSEQIRVEGNTHDVQWDLGARTCTGFINQNPTSLVDNSGLFYNWAKCANRAPTQIVGYAQVSGTTSNQQVNVQENGAVPPSGLYRLNINITVTAVASAGTITPQILFTDDAKAETISGTAFTATALGMTQVSAVIYSAGTANITAKCSTSGLTGTPTWNLRTSLERLSLGIV